LAALQERFQTELENSAAPAGAAPEPLEGVLQARVAALAESRNRVNSDLGEVREEIARHRDTMVDEELGRDGGPGVTRIPGRGPKYRLAAGELEAAEQREADLISELRAIAAAEEEASRSLDSIAERRKGMTEAARLNQQNRAGTIASEVAREQAELSKLQTERTQQVQEYSRMLMNGQELSSLRDDPMVRMTAYRRLQEDPVNGATVQLFGWMVKGLIVFLEIVPVLAKTLFSPPSVYAARVRAAVTTGLLDVESEGATQTSDDANRPTPPNQEAGEQSGHGFGDVIRVSSGGLVPRERRW
jgi:hypothetical protein